MALEKYRKKRDFKQTSEPSGSSKRKTKKSVSGGIFVVQKHAASRLHYDLRIEFEGVLKSWAVPKGPSLNPRDRRLAVAVEDHPIDYAEFEGTIPEGNYGAGSVIVWDRGTFKAENIGKGLREGNLKFELNGKKLKGGWALVRIRDREARDSGAADKNWLLIKERDDFADQLSDVTVDSPKSVLSGKTVESVGRLRADKTSKRKPSKASSRDAKAGKAKSVRKR